MKTSLLANLKRYQILSPLLTINGIVLLIFMVTVEDEPGVIPLLLISAGIIWFIAAHRKTYLKQSSKS